MQSVEKDSCFRITGETHRYVFKDEYAEIGGKITSKSGVVINYEAELRKDSSNVVYDSGDGTYKDVLIEGWSGTFIFFSEELNIDSLDGFCREYTGFVRDGEIDNWVIGCVEDYAEEKSAEFVS